MRVISWTVGIGVVALAVIRWVMPKRQKNTWQKAVGWTSGMVNPVSRYVMKAGRKMVRGMVR